MNDHIKNAKTELNMFISSPAKEHLEVAKVNALISIGEGIVGLLLFLNTQAKEDRKVKEVKFITPLKTL